MCMVVKVAKAFLKKVKNRRHIKTVRGILGLFWPLFVIEIERSLSAK